MAIVKQHQQIDPRIIAGAEQGSAAAHAVISLFDFPVRIAGRIRTGID